jgi:glycosyltransferase involved in cell wall biosynthesis
MNLKLLGVIDEEPFDPQTWSGSSRYFFNSLKNNGSLFQAISATPAAHLQHIYKLLSFQPGMDKWKFRYHLNTGYFRQMTRAALRIIEEFDSGAFNAVLQVGAWYDLTGTGKPVASYHDGNLATRLRSPYGYPSISLKHINKALEYERVLYSKIDCIFPMSRWLADSFCNDFGVNPNKVFPVGAGVNLPRIMEPDSRRVGTKKILFVGKDFRRKGGDVLLDAFAIVRKKIKDAELIIVGPELAHAPEGVHCEGFLSKANDEGMNRLLELYSEANIFVLPTLYEPFGIAFAEAMAHRLPCIGTSICAIPEIIDDEKTGLIVNPGDSRSLADAIITLLDDVDLRNSMGDMGYKKYNTNFRWDIIAAKITGILEKHV